VPRRHVSPSGFTLLELIVAMGISLVLVCLSVVGYTRFIESTAIDSGASMVNDALTEARQDAVTQNNMVEVRFYAATAGNAYDALQLRWHNTDGTTPAAAPAVVLPTAAVIDATAVHSSLVTTNTEAPASDATDPRLNASPVAFIFCPMARPISPRRASGWSPSARCRNRIRRISRLTGPASKSIP
jgi:prepilin-type N-terminal cleavage/methylation domain-containing protein